MPRVFNGLREIASPKPKEGLTHLLPCYCLIFVLKAWENGFPLFDNLAVSLACMAIFTGFLHLLILSVACVTCLIKWLWPPHAAYISEWFALVDQRFGLNGKEFDRSRIIIFTPSVIKLRVFAGPMSIAVGVSPNVNLERLCELLPGKVQVWNAMTRKRYLVQSVSVDSPKLLA